MTYIAVYRAQRSLSILTVHSIGEFAMQTFTVALHYEIKAVERSILTRDAKTRTKRGRVVLQAKRRTRRHWRDKLREYTR